MRLFDVLPGWIGVTPLLRHADCSSLSIAASVLRARWVASTLVKVRVA